MATVPSTAKVVVIGAGIVGNSLVHHLAELGWTDIVQIDQGPLPNPGGSTGHASNFIFLTDHSREITDLTLDSVEQYKEMGVFTQCGGFEVARTEERMEELRRRMSSAKAWGIEAELVTPGVREGEGARSSTRTRSSAPSGSPGVGVVDSLRAGTIMRERRGRGRRADRRPERRGRSASTSRTAGSARVRTDKGDIEAEYVVIACGVWSPKIGDMAGVEHPADPGRAPDDQRRPVPAAGRDARARSPSRSSATWTPSATSASTAPTWRSAPTRTARSCTEPEDIPSIEQSKLSPTELPFTEDDFDPQLEQAYELMPELLGADGAEIRYAINGLLSLTCDGSPDPRREPRQGPLDRVRGLDQGGSGRRPRGRRVDDPRPLRDRRRPQRHRALPPPPDAPRAHPAAHHRVVHQDLRDHPPGRAVRVRPRRSGSSPMYDSQQKLGAVFFETAGWERPFWYESNAGLVEEYGDAVMPREHEWDSRWWSPIINAEHLRMREAAGVIDLSAPSRSSTSRVRARSTTVQRTCVAQCDVAVGKVIYTPVLDAKGGFLSDLTVMRLGDDHFRVVTGGAHGMADRQWFTDQLPDDGAHDADRPHRRDLHDRPVGPAGPRHPRRRSPPTTSPARASGSCPAARSRSAASPCSPRGSPTSASSAGSSTSPMDDAAELWEALLEAGADTGVVPVGIGVYGTTGRIEKGYRAYGAELDAERTHRRGRHAAAQGQGRRLRRPGGLPRPARGRRRRRCSAR